MTDNRSKDSIDYVFQTHTYPAKDRLCLFFDENDPLIRITMKDWSPSMGHISRTHRVNLDRLLDRQNLDTGIHLKHVHTPEQIPDILTEDDHSWHIGQSHHTAHAPRAIYQLNFACTE